MTFSKLRRRGPISIYQWRPHRIPGIWIGWAFRKSNIFSQNVFDMPSLAQLFAVLISGYSLNASLIFRNPIPHFSLSPNFWEIEAGLRLRILDCPADNSLMSQCNVAENQCRWFPAYRQKLPSWYPGHRVFNLIRQADIIWPFLTHSLFVSRVIYTTIFVYDKTNITRHKIS